MAVLSTLAGHILSRIGDSARIRTLLEWSQQLTTSAEKWKYVLLAGLCVGWVLRRVHRDRNLPPGPWGVPGLGVLPWFSLYPHKECVEIAKRYGPINSFYVCNDLFVVLNTPETCREAFLRHSQVFAGRLDSGVQLFHELKFFDRFFYRDFSKEWSEDKKFALKSLRAFGFGQASLESTIVEEVEYLFRLLKRERGTDDTLDAMELLSSAFGNVITRIIFNTRHELPDKEQSDFIQATRDWSLGSVWCTLMTFMPFGRLYFRKELASFRHATDVMLEYCGRQYDAHKATLQDGITRDVTDIYLHHSDISRVEFMSTVGILVPNATETTPLTLQWLLFFMAQYPDVQKRVQHELDDVTGRSRAPVYADKESLPYVEATLQEGYRMFNAFPTSFPHKVKDDVQLLGYNIPRNTTVIGNFFACHFDEKLFPKPRVFDPTRYLDANGKFVRSDNILSFSLGRRACMGEPLTRIEMFIFFVMLMDRYTVSWPTDGVRPSLDYNDHEQGRVDSYMSRMVYTERGESHVPVLRHTDLREKEEGHVIQ